MDVGQDFLTYQIYGRATGKKTCPSFGASWHMISAESVKVNSGLSGSLAIRDNCDEV